MYAESGNAREAARGAGYSRPEKAAAALMLREDIGREIEAVFDSRSRNCRRMAVAGYERLAFGSVTDAVRLMFEDEPQSVGQYDLFNVAEIKRPKDGAMEIKFFDRIRALEKLEASGGDKENRLADFYGALMNSSEQSRSDSDAAE